MACAERNCSWVDALDDVVSALNSLHCTATGTSPHYAAYGRHPRILLPNLENEKLRSKTPLTYGMNLGTVLRQTHRIVTIANHKADVKLERRENRHVFIEKLSVGDKVLLHRDQSNESKSLGLPWVGPHKIIDIAQTKLTFLIEDDKSGKQQWVHRCHLRELFERPPHLEMPKNDSPEIDNGNSTSSVVHSAPLTSTTPPTMPATVPATSKSKSAQKNTPTPLLTPSKSPALQQGELPIKCSKAVESTPAPTVDKVLTKRRSYRKRVKGQQPTRQSKRHRYGNTAICQTTLPASPGK